MFISNLVLAGKESKWVCFYNPTHRRNASEGTARSLVKSTETSTLMKSRIYLEVNELESHFWTEKSRMRTPRALREMFSRTSDWAAEVPQN